VTARGTVKGERADAIAVPGAARRAATYRILFSAFLVLSGIGVMVVYYWHRHHPQVATANHGRTARGAATEMRLPKLNPTVAAGEAPAGTSVETARVPMAASTENVPLPCIGTHSCVPCPWTIATKRSRMRPVMALKSASHDPQSRNIASLVVREIVKGPGVSRYGTCIADSCGACGEAPGGLEDGTEYCKLQKCHLSTLSR